MNTLEAANLRRRIKRPPVDSQFAPPANSSADLRLAAWRLAKNQDPAPSVWLDHSERLLLSSLSRGTCGPNCVPRAQSRRFAQFCRRIHLRLSTRLAPSRWYSGRLEKWSQRTLEAPNRVMRVPERVDSARTRRRPSECEELHKKRRRRHKGMWPDP